MSKNLFQFFGIGSDKSIEERSITIFGFISKVVIVLYIFGVINGKPNTILLINFTLKVLISLYLIYRYNGFFNKDNLRFTNLDRKVVTSLALYNLIISFSDYVQYGTDTIRDFLKTNFTDKIILHNFDVKSAMADPFDTQKSPL